MSRITRPPRRPARWYPEGTVLTMRDGRKFVVVEHRYYVMCDPTFGNGGDFDRDWHTYKVWEQKS